MSDGRLPPEINAAAWMAACRAAFSEPDAHAAFRGATGRPQASKTGTPLDVLIDRAIGGEVDDAYMREFIDWFTVNHWGEEYAPEGWKQRNLSHD